MRPEKKLYVLSEYPTETHHVGYSLLFDLHSTLGGFGFGLIGIKRRSANIFRSKWFGRLTKRYEVSEDISGIERGSQLLVICSTPAFLVSLNAFGKYIKRFSRIAVYFVDSFDSSSMDGFGAKIFRDVDVVFAAIEESAADIKRLHKVERSYYLPFGIDALNHALVPNQNKIDVFSYGRIDLKYHAALQKAFGRSSSPYTYIHSTFNSPIIHSMREHRELHWKLMSVSSINLCFEPSNTERFLGRSPVLYRWFEGLAAGNVIFGTRPKCKSADDLLCWCNSTLELPKVPEEAPDALMAFLSDRERMQRIQRENQRQVLKWHDWRYRIATILEKLEVDLPDSLSREIDTLNLLSNRELNLDGGRKIVSV